MSENLDLVRSIYADWEHGDFSSAEWADPDIEYVSVDGPDPGTWKGLKGMAGTNRDFLSAWTEWRVVAEEYRELALSSTSTTRKPSKAVGLEAPTTPSARTETLFARGGLTRAEGREVAAAVLEKAREPQATRRAAPLTPARLCARAT